MDQWGSIGGVCQKLFQSSRRGVTMPGDPKSMVIIRRDPDPSRGGLVLSFTLLINNPRWDQQAELTVNP